MEPLTTIFWVLIGSLTVIGGFAVGVTINEGIIPRIRHWKQQRTFRIGKREVVLAPVDDSVIGIARIEKRKHAGGNRYYDHSSRKPTTLVVG